MLIAARIYMYITLLSISIETCEYLYDVANRKLDTKQPFNMNFLNF